MTMLHMIRWLWTLALLGWWLQLGWDLRGYLVFHGDFGGVFSVGRRQAEQHLRWIIALAVLWSIATLMMWLMA